MSDRENTLLYRMVIKYDKENQKYIVEVPEISKFSPVTADSREEAVNIADYKLNEILDEYEKNNEAPPTPLDIEETSGQLFLHLSPHLHRDLVFQSKIERVTVEELVKEIIARGLEARKGGRHPSSPRGRPHDSRIHRGFGKQYHQTMENKGDFLEYVRSLEKGRRKK